MRWLFILLGHACLVRLVLRLVRLLEEHRVHLLDQTWLELRILTSKLGAVGVGGSILLVPADRAYLMDGTHLVMALIRPHHLHICST